MTNETTDRELLELAAKAAGLRVVDRSAPTSLRVESDGCKSGVHWNPLADDGDAQRLAVKLCITVEQDLLETKTSAYVLRGKSRGNFNSVSGKVNRDAATRSAIVHTAAEIGRNMQ